MTLDEASRNYLAQAAAAGAPPLHELTPPQMREMWDRQADFYTAGPEVAEVRDVRIPTTGGSEFPARIYRPADAHGVIVYLHGGGFIIGSIVSYDAHCRLIADETGFTVLLAEYRKAPETKYPGAHDDGWAALTYAAEYLGELAFEGAPLVISGDSAGATIAASVAQRAAKEGGPSIALQALAYPGTDGDINAEAYFDPKNAYVITQETMAAFWDAYIPNVDQRTEPAFAPIHGSVDGVAPVLLILAEHDILREEGEHYAQKLRDAGVDVEVHLFEGQIHGFFAMPGLMPAADAARAIYAEKIRQLPA